MTINSDSDKQADKTTVLLVDDSAVVRGLLRQIIQQDDKFFIIATASDGQQAVSDYKKYQPDIVLMDIEMPHKNGLEALREILSFDRGAKVIMCSSLTQTGARETVEALSIGAADCLAKPTSKSIDRSQSFEEQLLTKLRLFAKKPGDRLATAARPSEALLAKPSSFVTDDAPVVLAPYPPALPNSFPLALAIGSSTGGPKALIELLTHVNKKISLPIFITQHIPDGFSRFLAENIEKNTGFPTHEAQQDMVIEGGHIYVAPGGKHMGIKPGVPKRIDILDTPPVNFCKPSVDVMLESILAHYGSGFLTVILTGMGSDGKNTAKKIAEISKSNIVLAQDKATSVVWGMPGAVAHAGICHAVLPLPELAKAINSLIYRKIPGKLHE